MITASYSEYRDTDWDWLGRVPAHWRIGLFRRVFEESSEVNGTEPVGVMLSVSGFRGVEPKVYESESQMRSEEMLENYRVVRPGQLAVNTMWLNYAGLGVSNHLGYVSPAYRAYSFRIECNKRFIHHLLRSEAYVKGYTGHLRGIRPNSLQMDRATLMTWPIVLPPLSEQRAIADYLDRETARIDTLIEEQQRLVELLRERRQATIEDAFELPVNTRLRHVIEFAQTGPFGTQLSADEYIEGGVPVINPTHVRPGSIEPDPSVTVSCEKADALARHRMQLGDIVLGRKGEVDKSALTSENEIGFVCGSDAMLLRPCRGTYPSFLWWFLQTPGSHSQLEQWSVGSTVAGLNQITISKIGLPLPPLEEQRHIAAYLDEQSSKIDTLIAETERFIGLSRERRSALITAAVTGQIDVCDERWSE